MTRIGIVGFGKLGQAIYDYAEKSAHLEVAWVWNRSIDKLLDLPEEKILEDLEDIPDMPLQAELIVEVAHPALWAQHSETLLSSADVLIGSPSGLSVQQVEDNVRTLCQKHRRTAFVARGALWGSEDIFRMRESIAEMHITMRKHPSHLKLHSELASKMPKEGSCVLFEGPVRELCPLAPNNVNTMATLALFGIGFDKTIGKLVSDSAAQEHTVTIEMKGTREGFCVKTERINPAPLGAVTGAQTFNSFLASLDNATVTRRTSSLQLC